jgi:hypothetical protein
MRADHLATDNQPSKVEIRSRPFPECSLCGTRGEPLYAGLTDRLFGAPGEWNLKCCSNSGCGLIWLDPMPLEDDIGKAYENYISLMRSRRIHRPESRARAGARLSF